jgi:protein phosphatase methylesterase 1
MGGAIAARAAASNQIKNLVGVVVIDVVEGTALAALPSMHNILENRPQKFPSIEDAIQWR